MHVLRPVLRALPLALVLAAGSPTAYAGGETGEDDPQALGVIGTGVATIGYQPSSDSLVFCGNGSIPASTRVTGSWTMTIAGVRGTSPFTPPTWSSAAYSVSHCVWVPRAAPNGSLTVDFAYTAVGDYVVVRSVHTVTWTPTTGNLPAGADVSR